MSQLKMKPHRSIEYNKGRGAVDRSNMNINSIECIAESVKWYNKLFFQSLGLAPLNLQRIYNVKTDKSISLVDCYLTLIRRKIKEFHKAGPLARKGWPSSQDQPSTTGSTHREEKSCSRILPCLLKHNLLRRRCAPSVI
jgi:hypothetical protein